VESIKSAYKLTDEDLKLVEVEAKGGEYPGVYYRMTFQDSKCKRYKVKI
jgi:hypothetical protein